MTESRLTHKNSDSSQVGDAEPRDCGVVDHIAVIHGEPRAGTYHHSLPTAHEAPIGHAPI